MTQNSEPNEDLRIRRTRKMLQEALIELTVEKGFGAVTVRDITERAMVNRSTFYRHYLDKYELLEQYMNEVDTLVFEKEVIVEERHLFPGEVPAGLIHLLRHVQKFADFYRVMLGQNGDPVFTQRFRQTIEKRFRYLIANLGAKPDPKSPPLDLKLSYISCAGVGAILWWLENDQPCSMEQLAAWLSQLTRASIGLSLQPHSKLPTPK